jgi:hypothetical protein
MLKSNCTATTSQDKIHMWVENLRWSTWKKPLRHALIHSKDNNQAITTTRAAAKPDVTEKAQTVQGKGCCTRGAKAIGELSKVRPR